MPNYNVNLANALNKTGLLNKGKFIEDGYEHIEYNETFYKPSKVKSARK